MRVALQGCSPHRPSPHPCFILFEVLHCGCTPPGLGSLFKTSSPPGDGKVTKPRVARPTGTHTWPVAMRVTGTQGGQPRAPPAHLVCTPGHQLVSGRCPQSGHLDPETLAPGSEQGPVLGRACHPEPQPYRSLRGAHPPSG